jgi:hypothetical protein
MPSPSREYEEAAQATGVDALRHKLVALAVSSLFAGLAGATFAYYHVSYYPELAFSPIWTFDAVLIHDARPLHAGLCEGSSDLIGWTPVTITPDMVGTTIAVFTAVEVKTGRVRVTEAQTRFLDAVTAAGGIARVARE